MSHANLKVNIKAIMLNSKGKILALKAQNNGPMADYYDMPGGRVEEYELGIKLVDILDREIREELGEIQYTVEPRPLTALTWTWPDGQSMVYIYYLVKYQSGDIRISDEHQSYEWIEYSKEKIEKHFITHHLAALEQYLLLLQHIIVQIKNRTT